MGAKGLEKNFQRKGWTKIMRWNPYSNQPCVNKWSDESWAFEISGACNNDGGYRHPEDGNGT